MCFKESMEQAKKAVKGGFQPISDEQWGRLEALEVIPGRPGTRGRCGKNDRNFINGVRWIQYTGSPWRALPQEFGHWRTTHCRFTRWTRAGVWKRIFKILSQQSEKKKLMIDSTIIRVHQHAAGSKKKKSSNGSKLRRY